MSTPDIVKRDEQGARLVDPPNVVKRDEHHARLIDSPSVTTGDELDRSSLVSSNVVDETSTVLASPRLAPCRPLLVQRRAPRVELSQVS
jgi:hypothetical protein